MAEQVTVKKRQRKTAVLGKRQRKTAMFGKRQIGILAGALAVLLVICTFYAMRYDKEHTLKVHVVNPQFTEERKLLLPAGVCADEGGVWTVKTVDSVWGVRQILEKEEAFVEALEDGTLLVNGLSQGTATVVVAECEGELRPGSKVEIVDS